jgi:hypothetical protein
MVDGPSSIVEVQWRGMESDHQPRAYESPALPLSYLARDSLWIVPGGKKAVKISFFVEKSERATAE